MQDYLQTPLWNVNLTQEERLGYLLSQLTIEEKLQCMGTGCPQIPRLGIQAFSVGGEGAHGVQARHDQEWDRQEVEYTTIFPNPIGMSASWDTELVRKVGRVTGTEARGLYSAGRHRSLSLWAPTVDMERDPRWGRTEEGYGEDPLLAGEMAGAYVEGMQGDDPEHLLTAATVKHFYANNVEEGRCWKSSVIDDRNREEYYLEPFRRVIQEHGAEGLMAAYNEINGIPCMLNPEVRSIAKEQWGVGHVVCDGQDVSQTVEMHHYFTEHAETIAAGLAVGIDCFTDDEDLVRQAATDAYQRGMISEEQIDEALCHHFGVMLRLGLFDPPGTNPYEHIGVQDVGTQEHHQIAREMATESVVLLQNNGILPLASECSVAVLGPLSDVWYKDWYSGMPPYYVTPVQGMQEALKNRIHVVENGMELVKIRLDNKSVSPQGKNYLGVNAADGTLHAVAREQAEVFRIEYWGEGRTTLRACSNGKLLKTEDASDRGETGLIRAVSEEAFGWFVKEVYQLHQDGQCYDGIRSGVLQDDKLQPQNEDAMGDSGVLQICAWNGAAIQFDQQGCLCVPVDASDNGEDSNGQEDADCSMDPSGTLEIHLEIVRDGIAEAVQAAAQADIAVLYLGANPMITCKEEVDRSTLSLPPYQQAMMEEVYRTNPNTVLVLISSVPFAIAWARERLPAILNTASGSMELGNGIADALTGAVSPAARLPMTWYQTEADLPPMDDYDIIQGERTYQYYQGAVSYPFGHGLTYGNCQYEDLELERIEEASGQRDQYGVIFVQVTIRNDSEVTTDEVVQIYGRKVGSVVKRPRKTLLAFRREKQMIGGEERVIRFKIPLFDLCYYSAEEGCRVLESGQYEIMAGASSEDIRRKISFVLK
ncbi:MAG: glycoside hydrolase family 3 C-terminal domain-containing protein [Lachnospiraceae bacterium]|nr:glycoside hydrolase family 3 C-terminal domain-containing protein [Lachnospiraceae bacterium]